MSISMSLSVRRTFQWSLVIIFCGACSTPDSERSRTIAVGDSAGRAASTVDSTARAVDSTVKTVDSTGKTVDSTASAAARAALDSAAREARLARLRSMQATSEDLAARDSLDIRVEVDIAARRVLVLDARSDTLARHRVAVGSKAWPTQPGEWTISPRVDSTQG